MKKKSWFNFLLCNLITVCCVAQTEGFKFYAEVDTVKTSAFYNIEITPELNAHLKTDHSDLRIVNGTGKWVPHILRSPLTDRTNHALLMDLKFSLAENSKHNTTLIIENDENISSGFGLLITNTAAERFAMLSGSADKKNWFVISDSILLNPVPSAETIENSFQVNFPHNSYRFYKLVIHNNNKDPLNIKGVVTDYRVPDPKNSLAKLVENPMGQVQQKDSGRISYIKITQEKPYQFNHISLQLSGVKYYSRQVDLYMPDLENHSLLNPGRLIQTFIVSNNSTLEFKNPVVKSRVFYLLIRNGDNLPLTVHEVKTAYYNRFITAYLETGDNYRLLADNELAVVPNYDILALKDKMPDSIPVLQFGKIIAADKINSSTPTEKNNKWLLWLAIGAALLILVFFTFRMFKEVDKRESK